MESGERTSVSARMWGVVLLAILFAGGFAPLVLRSGDRNGPSGGILLGGTPCSVSAPEGTSVVLNATCPLGPAPQSALHRWDIDGDGAWDTDWMNSSETSHVWGDDYSGTVRVDRGISSDRIDIAIEDPPRSTGVVGFSLWAIQAFVPTRPLLTKVSADISINWGQPSDLYVWIKESPDPFAANLSHGSIPYTQVPTERFLDPSRWPVIPMDPVVLDTNRMYYLVFNELSLGPGSFEARVTSDVRPDWPLYEWDWVSLHEIPDRDLRFRTYTREVTSVGEGAINVTVTNVPPSISLKAKTDGQAEAVLRVAGEKFHDVTATLERNGVPIANATVRRVPGNPNEQAVTLGTIPASAEAYSVTVTYTPLDDPVNGRVWGATPAWLILKQPGGDIEFHHTFNARHEETWTWRVDGLGPLVRGSGLELTANITDPGSDDIFVTWDFGDGASLRQTFLNDPSIGPDPYPSPDVHPRAITTTVIHEYATSGTYTVSVTAEDDDGGLTVATILVTL